MKAKFKVILSAAFLLAFSCAKQEPSAVQNAVDDAQSASCYVNGELRGEMVIQFDDATSNALAGTSAIDYVRTRSSGNPDLSELGITSIERLFPDAGEREKLHRRMGLHRYYTVRYDSSVPATKASDAAGNLDGVVGVEIPRRTRLCGLPVNDPYANMMWGLYNDGSMKGAVEGADINVKEVWTLITAGSPDVTVAVIDQGINFNSVEFMPVLVPAGTQGSWNFLKDNNKITSGSHGCNVGGIIGAVNNNGKFCCGVAGGDDGNGGVRLMSLQVFEGSDGSTSSTMAKAIVWAADNGALIANNSWGDAIDLDGDGVISEEEYQKARDSEISPSLKSAFRYFNNFAGCDSDGNQVGLMKGGVLFFAAGNDNVDVGKPAMDEDVVAVGAIGPDGKKASYSNYGDWVDICAPGGASGFGDEGIGGYIWQVDSLDRDLLGMAGTSQACPHVSGVAALMISALGGPGFTGDQLKELLIQNANHRFDALHPQPIGPLADAYTAITASARKPEKITQWTAEVQSNRVTVSLTVPANTQKCVVALSQSREELESLSTLSFPPGVSATVIEGVTAGETVEAAVKHLQYSTSYYIAVYSVNLGIFTISDIRTLRTPEDQAPVLVKSIPNILVTDMSVTYSICLSEHFMDPDGDDLTYSFTHSGAKNTDAVLEEDVLSIRCNTYGTSVFEVSATDEGGKSASTSFNLLARDPKKDYAADVYPNPCSDVLYVAPGLEDPQTVNVLMTNVSGATVYEGSAQADAFNPIKIDVSSLAVGVYSIKVTFGDKVYRQSVMKI